MINIQSIIYLYYYFYSCIECICPCIGEKKNRYMIGASESTGTIVSRKLGDIYEDSECS